SSVNRSTRRTWAPNRMRSPDRPARSPPSAAAPWQSAMARRGLARAVSESIAPSTVQPRAAAMITWEGSATAARFYGRRRRLVSGNGVVPTRSGHLLHIDQVIIEDGARDIEER